MRNLMYILLISLILALPAFGKSVSDYYGAQLCRSSDEFECVKVKRGDTWKKLFPDYQIRDVVKRINRTNMRLRTGTIIAVPKKLTDISLFDFSPFPKQIQETGKKVIIVDQNKLAWGAYDMKGELQWWGAISSGKNYCPDVKRACKTITGSFYVFSKEDVRCESSKFPVGEGGAKMPYCMFFHKGYALHGSYEVPGYRDSHGCIRLDIDDAKWLNHTFIDLPNEENNFQGTKVIIQEADN